MTYLRGKIIKKSDTSIALGDFKYHAHNATFSRKAVPKGIPWENYYSKNIKKMNDRESVNERMKEKLYLSFLILFNFSFILSFNDRESVNERMKEKLKRIRKDRYGSLETERNNYRKHNKYILECQQRLLMSKKAEMDAYNHK